MSTTIEAGFAAERVERRRKALRLVAFAAALVPAEAVGYWCARDGGLLWGARLLHHPYLFGLVAAVALATAFFLATGLRRTGIVTAIAAVPVLLLAFGTALLLGPPFPDTETHPAPGGLDRRVTVVEGADLIDPTWTVYVDEGTFPTTRRWHVGFFNGDDPANALHTITWDTPGRLHLLTGESGDERLHVIDLAPTTGKPSRTLTLG